MRSILLILCGGLIAIGAVLGVRALPDRASASAAATPDKAALGKAIRDYLIANPEVLVEAMQELERKQDSQRDTQAVKAILEHREGLLNDPETPTTGNPNGDVTIVEFSDYQCPYCKRAHAAVKSVLAADGKVRLVFKDLPILGEPSRIAALAALASRAQNKHLALHNALMEFNGKLDRDKIMEIAGSVGLDVAQLQKDMEDPKLKAIIERNMELAQALGVRGTPAFVIGKQFVPGAVDAGTLRQMIADARKG
ncbi:MAG: DsbA family protein [Reyranella sp.]|uniref:DsbA family protein n=1 Tax=Reyranella sp. TaxID=1929291 RepID=UPI001AC9199A|nr:DsbA family protein [Reyranella sp.]MBN9088800.1 DsbA family protein [Reyranella sp.]